MKRRLTISLFHAPNSLWNLVGSGAGVATGTDASVADGLANGVLPQFANPLRINRSGKLESEGQPSWVVRCPVVDFSPVDFGVSYCDRNGLMVLDRVVEMLRAINFVFAGVVVNQAIEAPVEQFVGSDRAGFAHPITQKPIHNPIPRSGRYGDPLAIST